MEDILVTNTGRDNSTKLRRDSIVNYVQEKSFVSVQDLSKRFDVSMVTIRADLDVLEEKGLIQRRHGGAEIHPESIPGEIAFQSRARINQEAKRQIGMAAAGMVNDGDTILIDSSTTGFYVARYLQGKNDLKVITNGVNTALELLRNEQSTIMVGGMLSDKTYGTVGRLGRNTFSEIRVQKAFLGARGITVRDGLTDSNLLEVELKQAMVEIASELIAIVDSSKFNVIGFSSFAPAERISTIITDNNVKKENIHPFEELGIKIIIV